MKSFTFNGDICSNEVKKLDIGAGWSTGDKHWYLGLYMDQEHFTFIPGDKIYYSLETLKIHKVLRGKDVVYERKVSLS